MPSAKIGCPHCANLYPHYFKFCPLDATDLNPPAGRLYGGSQLPPRCSWRKSRRSGLVARLIGTTAIVVIVSCAGLLLQTLRPRYGQLHVRTSPAGATIFVDGEPLGTSPLILTDLPSGRHQVRVALPGYQGTIRNIRIIADSNEILEWRLEPAKRLPNLQLTQISPVTQRRES